MSTIAGKVTLDKNVPRDQNDVPLPLTPATLAAAITYDTTVSTSTTVTFNAATTMIEVSALSQAIFLKWGGTASNSAFDEFIGAGMTRHYAVPTDSATGIRYTTAQFIEQAASATLVVIEK